MDRETGNIGYTRRRQTKQKHNTIWVGRHYPQTNTLDRTSLMLRESQTGEKKNNNIYLS
jgi:hypothetical protein